MRPSLPSVACALLALAAPAAAETLKVPAEFDTIAGAVAVAADGDTIQVAKGTYREILVLDKADLKLVGKKAVLDAQFIDDAIVVTGTGVSITGFTVLNGLNGVLGQGLGLTVNKCVVSTCSLRGMTVTGMAATLTGNTVTGCGSDGINFSALPSGVTLIDKNTCSRNGGDGIFVNGDGFVVSRNRCEENEGDGIDLLINFPVVDADAPPTTLEKNTCVANEDNGIFVIKHTSSLLVLHDNDCLDNADSGLALFGSNGDVQGNRCDGNRDEGMIMGTDHSLVSGNSASGNQGTGIVVTTGVFVADGTSATGDENTVSKNTCNDNVGDGIRVDAGSSNHFTGNKCSGNGDDGLDIQDPASAGCVVEGNNLSNNGHEGLDNGGTVTDVIKNTCKGNGAGLGPDVAGTGDGGVGSVDVFEDNKFGTGGESTASRLDNYSNTTP